MMKLAVICFTARGASLCRRLFLAFWEDGGDCLACLPKRMEERFRAGLPPEPRLRGSVETLADGLRSWTGRMFAQGRGMIFIGAAGIAVRAAAPWVRDKLSDPPLVVMDEAGRFVIPLLSGHVGGANRLARRIGQLTGAVPVITTATDVNGLFAVDVFASEHGLAMTDRRLAKEVSAALLEGEPVGFFSDVPIVRPEEEGLVPRVCRRNIWVTIKEGEPEREAQAPLPEPAGWLRLVPRAVVLGIGCRRGTPPETLRERVLTVLRDAGIDRRAVKAAATIDRKRDEPAIRQLAEEYGWPLRIYTAEELAALEGSFAESAFVEQTVGVGNVCERAAAAGGGSLLIRKQAGEGVTVAAALELPA